MSMISHVARINCLHLKSMNRANIKNNTMKSNMKRSIKKSNKIYNTKKNKAKNPNKANIQTNKTSNNWTNLIDLNKREPNKCSHRKLSKLPQDSLYLNHKNHKMLQQWTRAMFCHRSNEAGLSTSRTRVRRCNRSARCPKREPESATVSIRLRTWLHTFALHHRASNWSSSQFSFLSKICPCNLHLCDRQFHWTLNSKDRALFSNRHQSL